MLRALLNLILFLAAFLAVRGWIEDTAPERMKVAWLDAQEEPVAAVFIGSSRVYRQLDPARFDARMAAGGAPMRSLNLGMQGMRFAEGAYLAERVLQMELPGLRYLVLELSELETSIEEDNQLTERLVYWHSWPATWPLLRAAAAEALPLPERLARIELHLIHWGHRFGNLGQGEAVLHELTREKPEDFSGRRTLGPDGNGYRSLSIEKGPNFQARRRLFLEDLAKFHRAKEELMEPEDEVPADPALTPVLERLNRLCAERGVTPVYVILPVIHKQSALRKLGESGAAPALLRFDDPEAWPAFYQVKHRFDIHHLNARGAGLLTDALADAVLELEAESAVTGGAAEKAASEDGAGG